MFRFVILPAMLAAAIPASVGRSAPVQPAEIPFARAAWQIDGTAEFSNEEGFPNGQVKLAEGTATARDVKFLDGVIEFDMKPLAYADTGIRFRRRDGGTAEFVYLRAGPNCPASNDCIQYAPITHGLMQWDIYPDMQGQSPVRAGQWNHMRLVVSGERLRVFVNGETSPSLDVPRLQNESAVGGIELKGPASFANLRLTESPHLLPRVAVRDASGIVARWSISPVAALPSTSAPESPTDPAGWHPLRTEPNGLANISRALGSPLAPAPQVVWLRTRVVAAKSGARRLSLGYARQLWAYVNGRPIYSGTNTYHPAEQRLSHEGRFAVDNAVVDVPLRAGSNCLMLAVGNRWKTQASRYGWGVSARFSDQAGLRIGGDCNPDTSERARADRNNR